MHSYFLLMICFLLAACQAGTEPLGATGGEVKVISGKKSYAPGEALALTISNGGTQAITTTNQQSFCTVLVLERRVAAGWETVRSCTLNAPSREVQFAAGSVAPLTLGAELPPADQLPAGNYRATLTYSLGQQYRPGQRLTASSDIFSIR